MCSLRHSEAKHSLGRSSTFRTAAAVQRAAAGFPLPVLGRRFAELSVVIETSGLGLPSSAVLYLSSSPAQHIWLVIQVRSLSLPFLAQRVVLLITGLCFQEIELTSQNFSTERSQLPSKCKQ